MDVPRCVEMAKQVLLNKWKKRSFAFCHTGDAEKIKTIWDIRIQISPYLKDIIDKLYFF